MSIVSNAPNAPSTNDLDRAPPRFKWLKRFAIASILLIVALCILRFVWGQIAYHRLNAQLAEYRAAGQLVDVSEFDAALDAVPDERNAAILFEKAIDVFVPATESGFYLTDFLDEPESFETQMPAAHELMKANENTFRIIREARSMPEVAWRTRLSNPRSTLLGGLQRTIAKALWVATVYHFRTGNHDEAVTTLRDFLAFNNAVDAQPTLISSLIAWATYSLSFSLIEEHLSELQVATATEEAGSTFIPAQRGNVESLLQELLDEDSVRQNAVRSYYGGRAEDLQYLEQLGITDMNSSWPASFTTTPWKQIMDFMGHPLLVLDVIREMRYATMAALGVTEDSWAEAYKHFVPESDNANLLSRMSRPLTYSPFGPIGSTAAWGVLSYFETLARRRMTALAVAIRLYEIDHGRRPTDLESLVPNYLPELPRDPFAVDSELFRYKPGADRPFLYSVGPDGIDKNGEQMRHADGRFDRERSDIVFHLEPESASTDEADDHNQNIENGQRKDNEEHQPKPEPSERKKAS